MKRWKRTDGYVRYYKPDISRSKRRKHYQSKGRGYNVRRSDRPRYTSKAYKEYVAFYSAEYRGYTLGELMATELYEESNRPGFMSRILGLKNVMTPETPEEKERRIRREIYKEHTKPYDRRKSYKLTDEMRETYKRKKSEADAKSPGMFPILSSWLTNSTGMRLEEILRDSFKNYP